MQKIKILLFLILSVIAILSNSQTLQNIRGTVTDKYTGVPIPGVNVIISETDPIIGTATDTKGEFKIQGIRVGRVDIQVSAIGYKPILMKNLLLTTGKELVLEIKMEEDISILEEIVVKAENDKSKAINRMAVVSARSFNIEETEKYAGSLGDPSRMAQNFAGVFTAGDQRNDIIIRGNSPSGLLWRLDGVNIPNPNHFGALGSTGGPVSMLNNNLLTNSDFFTGAWPAEFGNAISGVFDLNMRNGNNQTREHLFQIGFNGFELGTEGPISKKHNSSYLINYRNSTLDVLDKLGFPVAGGAIPKYQDLTFKINIPTQKAGRFSFSGIAGNSSIFFDHRNNNDQTYDNFSGADTRNAASMMTYSIHHLYFFNEKSRIETFVNYSQSGVKTSVEDVKYKLDTARLSSTGDSIYIMNKKLFFHENNFETKATAGSKFKHKLNSKNYFDLGISAEIYKINYVDSAYVGESFPWPNKYIKLTEVDTSGLVLLQTYAQWHHRFNNNLELFTGIHFQHLNLNKKAIAEPRVSLKYSINSKNSIAFGYGLHSQIQSLFLYYTKTPIDSMPNSYIQNNKNLDFTKSHQFVLAYDCTPLNDFRIKFETYYQHLYDVPVLDTPSYYSVLNSGAGFYQQRVNNLVNKGKGRNYGVEITIEKFFSKHYYILLTGSLFNSEYKTLENKWRSTVFNNNYIFNVLAGYEFVIKKSKMISIDLRTVYGGGKRFIPMYMDEDDKIVYDFDNAFAEKTAPYFRTDLRISYKLNMKRITQEWAIDFQNITNHQNIYSQYFDSTSRQIKYSYQQGFYPMFLYRLTF